MDLEETMKTLGQINKDLYGINPFAKIESIDGLNGEEERLALKALNEDVAERRAEEHEDDPYRDNVIEPELKREQEEKDEYYQDKSQ